MAIVVDASVALKWVLEEDGSKEAAELLSQTLLAPTLWIAECANALCTLSRKGVITRELARKKLGDLRESTVIASPLENDIGAAVDISAILRQPAYDCIYLALANREGTYLVTADGRFHAAVARSGAFPGAVRMLLE